RGDATRDGPPGRGRARAAREGHCRRGRVPSGAAAGGSGGDHGEGADRAAAPLPADPGGGRCGEQLDHHLPGADRPPEVAAPGGGRPDDVAAPPSSRSPHEPEPVHLVPGEPARGKHPVEQDTRYASTTIVRVSFMPREKLALLHRNGSPKGPRTKNSRSTTDHARWYHLHVTATRIPPP